jgi:hypothetical protein
LLIFVAVIFELWRFGVPLYSTRNPADAYRIPPEINIIKEKKGLFRTFDPAGGYFPILARNNIQSLGGFDPLILKQYYEFLSLSGPYKKFPFESYILFDGVSNFNILKLLNTKYIIYDKQIDNENVKFLYKGKENVYEIKGTLPRAFFVSNAKVVSETQTLKILEDPDFNPLSEVLLNKNPNAPLTNKAGRAKITIDSYRPNRIELSVNAESSGFLVLSEIYYPGWKAYVDDSEAEIYKTNYTLRSISVREGKHKVRFVYEPDSFKRGVLISTITLFLYIGTILFYIKRLNATKGNTIRRSSRRSPRRLLP